ncbi:hypothetical protein ACFQU5_05175 [Ureibacillus sp. GCM10028918]
MSTRNWTISKETVVHEEDESPELEHEQGTVVHKADERPELDHKQGNVVHKADES